MISDPDPGIAAARSALDDAARALADARTRLLVARSRASVLALETDWRTPAARSFHRRVEEWRDDLVRLAGEADAARDLVLWTRSDLEAQTWRRIA